MQSCMEVQPCRQRQSERGGGRGEGEGDIGWGAREGSPWGCGNDLDLDSKGNFGAPGTLLTRSWRGHNLESNIATGYIIDCCCFRQHPDVEG